MTSRELIYKTIKGEPTDRIPFALWRHFPESDGTSQDLANAIIEFQKKFQFDLIKITPSSGFLAEALSGKFTPQEYKEGFKKGTRSCIYSPIKKSSDWHNLSVLDDNNEILAREIKTVQLVRKGIGNDVPIFQTIPNPLTIAKTLREQDWINDLKHNPRDLQAGLDIISKTVIKFGLSSLKAGADGIFFFTQVASYDFLKEEEYQEFGTKYDLHILDILKKQKAILIFHIHGLNIMFNLVKSYPVDIMNWHDRRTKPTIAEAQQLFNGVISGGIDEKGVLLSGTPEDVIKQIIETAEQAKKKKIIISGGCTIPINTPEINILAFKKALKN